MKNLLHCSVFVSVAGVLFSGATPLRADLTEIQLFKNVAYKQTSGVAPTTPSVYFANEAAFMANPGDFTSVSVSYPGPASPDSLPLFRPTEFLNGPSFPTQASMDTAYPFGTYLFNASNSVTMASEQASLDYTVDAYTADIPVLTAATFAALQGMDPNAPFTFKFNSFTPNSNATLGQTFLTVFGSSFAQELSPIATSVVMPAGSLLPGTTYTYELDFSDRITGTDPINGVPALVAFDVRTDGTFTPAAAAVPEPSTLIPLAIVILGVMAQRRRRGDKTTTSCR